MSRFEVPTFVSLMAGLSWVWASPACQFQGADEATQTGLGGATSDGPAAAAAPAGELGRDSSLTRTESLSTAIRRVEVRVPAEVDIEVGTEDRGQITVRGSAAFVNRVHIQQFDETLKLDVQRSVQADSGLRIQVDIPQLSQVSLYGAGVLRASNISAPDLVARLEGAGSLVLDGDAERVELESKGAGSIQAAGLRSQHVRIDARGTASMEVFAEQTLDVSIMGMGTVRYRGRPHIRPSISGFSDITPLE